MSASLYSFSSETISGLQKFRFSSIKSRTIQAVIYTIEKESYEIKRENDEVYSTIEELIEELPDNTPRYVLLSYPLKTSDGRLKTPLVLLYWIPPTSGQQGRMLYAGAVELMREKAGVSKLIKVESEEDFEDFEEQLQ